MAKGIVIFIIVSTIGIGGWLLGSETPFRTTQPSSTKQTRSIYRDDAIDEHWTDIKRYIDASEFVTACSESSEECYSLFADIKEGYIRTLYFENDGYLNFYAEIDKEGYAYDTEDNLNGWEFTVDYDLIDNAIDKWAEDTDVSFID